ncbi:MAG: hypothetical protein FH753_14705 [Firmicutes bacterium]|nr:hypothetical protein [Bacillota bacterium]
MEVKTIGDNIEITDKDVIVYLVATGFQIKKAYKDPKRNRSIVVFKNSKELNEAIINYANKKGKVNVANFIEAEKRVKNLFYLNKNNKVG